MGWFRNFFDGRRKKRELKALEEIKRSLKVQDVQVLELFNLCRRMERDINSQNFGNLAYNYKVFVTILKSLHDKESLMEIIDHKILRRSVFKDLRKAR